MVRSIVENRVMPLYSEEVTYPKLWSLVDTVLELRPLSSLETYHKKKKKEEAETKFSRNLNSKNFEQNEKVCLEVQLILMIRHSWDFCNLCRGNSNLIGSFF